MATSPEASKDFSWYHFVGRAGPEGHAWIRRYVSTGLADMNNEAVTMLRRKRIDEGRAVLERLKDGMDALRTDDPSIGAVLDRWYYGVLGYYFYCVARFDDAHAAMAQAQESVARAVESRRFLFPLVVDCYEFRLHRARIARNERRWNEMWDHIAAGRSMMAGRMPFCVLSSGAPFGIEDVKACYHELGLTDDEREGVRHLIDDPYRARAFEAAVEVACRLPSFVIPYP